MFLHTKLENLQEPIKICFIERLLIKFNILNY